MARRGLMIFLSSLIGGVGGAFAASLIMFWFYPLLRSDLSIFLRDLFSFGGVASAAFVWLVHVPILVVLLLFCRRFMVARPKNWSYAFFMAVSFLPVFINQIRPFASIADGMLEYLFNAVLAGTILIGAMAVLRSRPNR
ncbi:hypothetical protein [Rugamonas sp. DEMB1]|uniref:hypothetical protein n=1 Tax=Rugamonas sp. DEMB1 TaxID=3039386 RepID=UPI00244D76A8|nr:hypothetical protein [Rugamonas sp. DEMB1]WGG49023.1 hypothetical protein QC826_20650 [Rugamonas sp. DEMB1]